MQKSASPPVPYARIHNEGGEIKTQPTVTPQMRKMAWAKVYSIAGVFGKEKLPKDLSEDARKWRNLALTKKKRLNIKAHMPKRQFMRENRQLEDMIKAEIEKSLKRIQNGITSAQLN